MWKILGLKEMRIFGNVYMGKIAGSEKEGFERILEQGWEGPLEVEEHKWAC